MPSVRVHEAGRTSHLPPSPSLRSPSSCHGRFADSERQGPLGEGEILHVERVDGVQTVLALGGEFDLASAPMLRRHMDSVLGRRGDVIARVIDISGVTQLFEIGP